MNLFESFFLGLLQGLTEFLPVSSSAHLVLAPYFFSFEDPGLAFDVALHMGTLAAIILAFRHDWLAIAISTLHKLRIMPQKKIKTPEFLTLSWLIFGTLPAALCGLFFEKQAEQLFRNPKLIALTLTIFGFLLYYYDQKGNKKRTENQLKLRDVMWIGMAQALAIIPGVSRSGITITMALALGLTRSLSMRVSFLLSAPIIAGAGILKFKHILALVNQSSQAAISVCIGFFSSFIFGILAILILRKMALNKSFKPFFYYRITLALIIVAISVFR